MVLSGFTNTSLMLYDNISTAVLPRVLFFPPLFFLKFLPGFSRAFTQLPAQVCHVRLLHFSQVHEQV